MPDQAATAYRYTLVRSWDASRPMVSWICLNPSTADATVDDPTVRKIRGFSRRWGFGAFLLVNLFPMRATSPAHLIAATPRQRRQRRSGHLEYHLSTDIVLAAYGDGSAVVFAWGARGNHPALRGRRDEVLALPRPDKPFWCLGRTKAGEPRHPLMLSYDTPQETIPADIDPTNSTENSHV